MSVRLRAPFPYFGSKFADWRQDPKNGGEADAAAHVMLQELADEEAEETRKGPIALSYNAFA